MTKEIINAGACVDKRLRSGTLRNSVYMLGSPIEDASRWRGCSGATVDFLPLRSRGSTSRMAGLTVLSARLFRRIVCVRLGCLEDAVALPFRRRERRLRQDRGFVRQSATPFARRGAVAAVCRARTTAASVTAGHADSSWPGLELDGRYGMHLPDHRHVRLQAGWPGMLTVRMTHVEEQRALDFDFDRWIVEIVRGAWEFVAEERLVGVARGAQLGEGWAAARRQPGDLHGHVHARGGIRVTADDEMKVIVGLTAGGIEKAAYADVPLLLGYAPRALTRGDRRIMIDHVVVRRQ